MTNFFVNLRRLFLENYLKMRREVFGGGFDWGEDFGGNWKVWENWEERENGEEIDKRELRDSKLMRNFLTKRKSSRWTPARSMTKQQLCEKQEVWCKIKWFVCSDLKQNTSFNYKALNLQVSCV